MKASYVDRIAAEIGENCRCMWQIRPSELPADMPPMALELWQGDDGKLHIYQVLLEDREPQWYRRVRALVRFSAAR